MSCQEVNLSMPFAFWLTVDRHGLLSTCDDKGEGADRDDKVG